MGGDPIQAHLSVSSPDRSPRRPPSGPPMDQATRKRITQKVQDISARQEAQRQISPESPDSLQGEATEVPQEALQEEPKRVRWVQTTFADLFFGGWIIINALVLALETDLRSEEDESIGWFLGDSLFNTVFLVELILRLEAERLRWICSLWNVFDALLVTISIWDSWVMRALGLNGSLRFATLLRLFRLLRLVRILRVLRLVRFLKELMLLISGIKSAMMSMVWGLLLLGMTIFITALFITKIVGKACCDPDDNFQNEMYRENFGNLFRSAFTLFQFTMEFQPDICRESWEDGVWLTFALIAYSGFTNITLLNTVASVIVDNIMTISNENKQAKEAELEAKRQEDIAVQINQFFSFDESTGTDSVIRLDQVKSDARMNEIMDLFGVEEQKAEYLFKILDIDKSGCVSRSEFRERLLRVDMEVEMTDLLKVEHQVLSINRNFMDMKSQFDDQQKEIMNLLYKIETKQQQGDKSRMRHRPGPMTTETWVPNEKDIPVSDCASPEGAHKEKNLVSTGASFDEKLDSAAQEGSRTINVDEQPEEQSRAEARSGVVTNADGVLLVGEQTGPSRPQSRLDVQDRPQSRGEDRPLSRLDVQEVSPELLPGNSDVEPLQIMVSSLSSSEVIQSERFRDAMTQTARDAGTQTVEAVELPSWSRVTPMYSNVQALHSDDGENFLV